MKRGRVPRRTRSDTVRRHSPFRVKSPHDESRAEPLPWRSNDVRTSCEDRAKGRGEQGSRSSRDGLERWSKGGGEKGRGTGRRVRRSTTELLRVVFECAERSEPPVQLLVWGERVPSIEPFSFLLLHPPSPVARSRTKPCSPRPLHPCPQRPLQFQAAAAVYFVACLPVHLESVPDSPALMSRNGCHSKRSSAEFSVETRNLMRIFVVPSSISIT